jgi:plastocyanin
LLAVAAALSLIAVACGSSSKSDASSTTTTAPAASGITVQVDGKAPDFNAGFLAYFPKSVQAHPGDTLTFQNNYSGEPHTVTLGTAIDAAMAAAAAADPNGPPPPEVAKLPLLLPQGPGDADQTAVRPCVVASGDLPEEGAGCTDTTQPFDGKQVFYNSGFLAADTASWKLKLADDIAPGTYSFYCLLHGPGMSGTIKVVPEATTVPSASEVAAQATQERDAQLAKVKDAVAALPQGSVPALGFVPAQPGQVFAGSGVDDPDAPAIENFGPQQIKIPVGGSVTWVIVGPHTVTFNAPTDASTVLVKGDDGGYHINPKAAGPAGGPAVEPAPEPSASGPPPAPLVTDGGSFDGTGFRNSGLVVSFPPALSAYKLTFTKAGTFGYVCLVHPGMIGSVQVG